MSTIADVARRAGVSKMTVSRVINDSGYISQETRERVEQAISELGYIPNALARSLRFKQTRTIALILTDITNPFFTTLARGVEDVASEQGFSVIFCNTDESEKEEAEYINVLLQKQVDGLLLVPTSSTEDAIAPIREQGLPFVLLDRYVPGTRLDSVRGDSIHGAYALMQHLLDLGHRRIAVLSGPAEVTTSVDRVEGVRRAAHDAGLELDLSQVYYGPFSLEGGYAMATQALAAEPRPTAIYAMNNFIAMSALRVAREIGLRVPEDLSVVTFDDLPAAFVAEPFLTVAEQPAYEMGQQATALLLDRLSSKGPTEPMEIILPTRLIVRKSSGPVPA